MENNNIANYVNIFASVRIIQMLEVYERAYRLYVVTYKIRYVKMLQRWDKLLSTGTVQYQEPTVPQMIPRPQMIPKMDRKWSRPQVIPKVDRKWCRKNLRNGMDFMGLITKMDWLLKRNLFLSPSKEKGKEDATSQVNLYKVKKKME